LLTVGGEVGLVHRSVIPHLIIVIVLQMFVAVLHENIEVAEETTSQQLAKNRNSIQPLPKRGVFRWLAEGTPFKHLLSKSDSSRADDTSPPILGSSKTAIDFMQKPNFETSISLVSSQMDALLNKLN
jgi:hypothetical protein